MRRSHFFTVTSLLLVLTFFLGCGSSPSDNNRTEKQPIMLQGVKQRATYPLLSGMTPVSKHDITPEQNRLLKSLDPLKETGSEQPRMLLSDKINRKPVQR